jgi:hypothetical protein
MFQVKSEATIQTGQKQVDVHVSILWKELNFPQDLSGLNHCKQLLAKYDPESTKI